MPHVRIGLCSDTHYWFGGDKRFGEFESQLQPWSTQLHEVLLVELTEAAPDFVFHLGDLTCGGGSFEMPDPAFFATVEQALAGFHALPADFHLLPGNHDLPAGGEDWAYLSGKVGLEPGLGKTIDVGRVRLILLNAQGHSRSQVAAAWPSDPTSGWVSEAELARLDEALATAGGRTVLLFVHQVLQPWSGPQPWRDLFGVDNGAEVLAVMDRYQGIKAVFQAHAHRFHVQQRQLGQQSCTFVILPAIIQYPLAWLQLEVTDQALQLDLKQLPVPELADLSLASCPDERWRVGQTDWHTMTIPLL